MKYSDLYNQLIRIQLFYQYAEERKLYWVKFLISKEQRYMVLSFPPNSIQSRQDGYNLQTLSVDAFQHNHFTVQRT